jgi:hypothetical protein
VPTGAELSFAEANDVSAAELSLTEASDVSAVELSFAEADDVSTVLICGLTEVSLLLSAAHCATEVVRCSAVPLDRPPEREALQRAAGWCSTHRSERHTVVFDPPK